MKNRVLHAHRWSGLLMVALGMMGCQPPSDRPDLVPPAPSPPRPVEQINRLPDDTVLMLRERGYLNTPLMVVDFWAPWDPGSAAQRSQLDGLADALGPDVSIVDFSLPDPALAPAEKTGQGEGAEWVASPAIQEAFGGIRAIPTRVLVDAEGRVLARFSGFVDLEVLRDEIGKRLTPPAL